MAFAGSDRAAPLRVGLPRFWEGEFPAEPRWPSLARTEPRPYELVCPGFGRAKLLLSRDGLRWLGQSRAFRVGLPRFWEGEAPAEPRWLLPARTEPPPELVCPGSGRAKLR